jgi:hypothetical protein
MMMNTVAGIKRTMNWYALDILTNEVVSIPDAKAETSQKGKCESAAFEPFFH